MSTLFNYSTDDEPYQLVRGNGCSFCRIPLGTETDTLDTIFRALQKDSKSIKQYILVPFSFRMSNSTAKGMLAFTPDGSVLYESQAPLQTTEKLDQKMYQKIVQEISYISRFFPTDLQLKYGNLHVPIKDEGMKGLFPEMETFNPKECRYPYFPVQVSNPLSLSERYKTLPSLQHGLT